MRLLLFFVGVGVCSSLVQALDVDSLGVVVPSADAVLDAWLLGRWFATAVDASNPRRRPSVAAMRGGIANGVARGLIISDAAGASAVDFSLEELGVISFKPVNGSASAQSWLNSNGNRGIFSRVELDSKVVILRKLMGGSKPGGTPRTVPSPPPPALLNPCPAQTGITDLWGLDRLDSANAALDFAYTAFPCTSSATAATVHVFVVDTGLFAHSELGARLSAVSTCTVPLGSGATCADSTTSQGQIVPPYSDDNGHGTHCGGTVGGSRVGASKATTVLHAVKVLGASGSGSLSGLTAGINWVIQAVAADPALRPAVVSMSLGFGGLVPEADAAVASLVSAGITTVVAAGNSGANACGFSPASAASVITVGAVDTSSARAPWSNFGTCVDLFAPGVNIKSSFNSFDGYASLSGTSMATPHVAGVAALILSRRPCLTPADVVGILKRTGAPVVRNAGFGSTTLLINAPAAVREAATWLSSNAACATVA